MKTTIKALMYTAIFSTSVMAQSNLTKNDPIKDQIELTRTSIQNLVDALRNITQEEAKGQEDFQKVLAKFNARLEKALVTFSKESEISIVKPASVFVDQFTQIDSNPSYSVEEKKELLSNVTEAFWKFDEAKNLVYQNMIEDLVNAINGMDTNNFFFESNWYQEKTFEFFNPQKKYTIDSYGAGAAKLKENNSYANSARVRLKQENICFTSTCLTLTSMLYQKFLTMIKTTIDKGIIFNLKGSTFGVSPSKSNYGIIESEVRALGQNTKLPFSLSTIEFATISEILQELELEDFHPFHCKENVSWRLSELLKNSQIKAGYSEMIFAIKASMKTEILSSAQNEKLNAILKRYHEFEIKIDDVKKEIKKAELRTFDDSNWGRFQAKRNKKAINNLNSELSSLDQKMREVGSEYYAKKQSFTIENRNERFACLENQE